MVFGFSKVFGRAPTHVLNTVKVGSLHFTLTPQTSCEHIIGLATLLGHLLCAGQK